MDGIGEYRRNSRFGSPNLQLTGSNVKEAGRATATTADQAITTNFNHVDITNDGPQELQIAVDEDSTISTKRIFIAAGEVFSMHLKGSSLHYSVAGGSAVMRYVLT